MAEELEAELDKLMKEKIVSEETAAVYLSQVRKLLKEDKNYDQKKED
jgi:hypothetical protein